eukprot:TRINITY_DN167_c3_g2_i1.p1 TRINITY_DN167_c3_g2~~TRINITY_DN167_c3_g2_i1.p1  ORF type:complete len:430 (-),score=94.16 TRINITY_DN167_c3_g2_i1:55-1344(-)
MNENDIVKLNVGGKKFLTTKTTLKSNGENFFTLLLDKDENKKMNVIRDDEGYIFIDRSYELFSIILEYLRTSILDIPDNVSLTSFKQELEFYCINSMEIKIINEEENDQNNRIGSKKIKRKKKKRKSPTRPRELMSSNSQEDLIQHFHENNNSNNNNNNNNNIENSSNREININQDIPIEYQDITKSKRVKSYYDQWETSVEYETKTLTRVNQIQFLTIANNRNKDKKLSVILPHCDLTNLILFGLDLQHSLFTYSNLLNQNFLNCDLSNCDFTRSNLEGSRFENAKLNGTIFLNGNLKNTKFKNNSFSISSYYGKNPDFRFSNLSFAVFENCVIGRTFMNCDLSNSKFINCRFRYAVFRKVNLKNATFNSKSLVEENGRIEIYESNISNIDILPSLFGKFVLDKETSKSTNNKNFNNANSPNTNHHNH